MQKIVKNKDPLFNKINQLTSLKDKKVTNKLLSKGIIINSTNSKIKVFDLALK